MLHRARQLPCLPPVNCVAASLVLCYIVLCIAHRVLQSPTLSCISYVQRWNYRAKYYTLVEVQVILPILPQINTSGDRHTPRRKYLALSLAFHTNLAHPPPGLASARCPALVDPEASAVYYSRQGLERARRCARLSAGACIGVLCVRGGVFYYVHV